jgi:hypothetical protein
MTNTSENSEVFIFQALITGLTLTYFNYFNDFEQVSQLNIGKNAPPVMENAQRKRPTRLAILAIPILAAKRLPSA